MYRPIELKEELIIPADRVDAVARGLRTAFGVPHFEDVSQVFGGRTSSLVYRVRVRGVDYLLKVIVRAEDPSRHFRCMASAAEAGLAPRVHYVNVEDRLFITDFVPSQPLSKAEAFVRLPVVLRELHALPAFERAPFNTTCTFFLEPTPARESWLQKFRAACLLPPADLDLFFTSYAELAAVCARAPGDPVASHNDLFKPDNILFDGQRVWLVDWEAAFLNDRYADLAAVGNQMVASDSEEIAYLAAYFGSPPTLVQRARFHLMSQIAHLFYTTAFLSFGSAGRPMIDWRETVPEFHAYQGRIWAGEAGLATPEEKIRYGKVHWQRFRQNLGQARYREALRIVADLPGAS